MAIIYSYPTVTPVKEDLILGTDVSAKGNPTKNFTIESIIDLVTIATGDLQFVLDLGNVATGRDINLTNNAFRGSSFITTGGATVSGTTGVGFTNVTSTAFTGTIATAAQPNITSLGALTGLVIDGPISGTNLVNNSSLTGAQNDNVVSTLAIKTYVDNKVGLYDTLQEILANGNTTGGSDIVVSAGDDITFTDTSKILMGTTSTDNLEIYSDSANSIVIDRSPGALKLQTSLLSVRDEADTIQTISANAAGAVELYHVGDKKIETLVGGAKVTGAFQATTSGTFVDLINTGTYSDSSGDVGTAGQILSSTGTGTNWVTEVPLYNWSLEGTTIPSGTAVTVTDGTNITTTWDAANFDLTIATTGVPDGSGAANQVTYWSDTDTLTGAAGFTFAGGATGKVAIAGELEVGGVLTDGAFTGSSGTYTGYTSITSTDFIGALTGNASTATALASGGAIAITGDTSSTGGPHTYTSGGAVTIPTTIANTTVTSKTLLNLPTPTSTAIAASDSILDAMAKLQGQITGLAGSLAFEGTWNANTDTPTLSGTTPSNGTFYIVSVAGATDLSGITDWLVGDWAIYVDNGAGTNAWQKLDQSNEVLGSGAANKIAKWTSTNTLATGLIADDGTDVTIGNSGNLIVQGNTTLGDADTDTTSIVGPATMSSTARFNVGISLGANNYGSAGQALTSGGGSATVNTWTTLDNYQYWVLSDGTNTTNINATDTVTFTGASGITVAESAGTITITGSAQPGTGTQYTLPVWSTTTSLGDSMVSQNAGGTELTVSGNSTLAGNVTSTGFILATNSAPVLEARSTSGTQNSSLILTNIATLVGTAAEGLKLYYSGSTGNTFLDSYYSTGSINFRTKVSSTPITGLSISADGNSTFAGNVNINSTIPRINLTDLQQDDWAIINDNGIFTLQCTTGSGLALTLDTSNNATFAGNVTIGTGIIKSSIGGDIAITQGAIGLRLNDAASAISPTTATSNNDNAVDLGVANIRFKDLYLGGSITSGGNATFAGNVGIGISPNSSYSKLQVKSPSSSYGFDLIGRDAGSNSESQITFWNSNQTTQLAAIFNIADNLYFSTGTTERMRIDSSGNVQLQTVGAQLRFQNSAGAAPYIKNSGEDASTAPYGQNLEFYTGGSQRLTIDSSGFVTIKNNPESTDASLTLSNTDGTINIDQSIGYLNFYSNDNSTSSTGGVGGIGVYAEAAFNTSFTPSYMSFYTHATTTNDGTVRGNVTERIRIDSAGTTAIIKTSAGSSTTPLVVRNAGSSIVGTESKILLSTVANDDRGAYISSIITDSSNGNALILATNTAGSGPTERMRIESDGDVLLTGGNLTMSGDTPFIVLSNTAETESGITLLDSADASQSAKITYDAGSSNSLKFYNNASNERMRIDSSGNIVTPAVNTNTTVTIGVANATSNSFASTKRGNLIVQASSAISGGNSMGGGDLNLNAGNSYSSGGGIAGDVNIRAGYNTLGATTASVKVYTGNAERMTIGSTGRITMQGLDGKTQTGSDVRFNTTSKEIYYFTSSRRYKTNIVNLENSLDKINALRPVRFKDKKTGEATCGLIAEETFEIIPDVVFTKEIEGFDEPQIEGLNYSDLVPFLIKSIQELKADNDNLKARIETLENN